MKTTWTTDSGKKVTAVCEIITEQIINADGDNFKVECCEKSFNINVEGVGDQGGYINRNRKGNVGNLNYVAICGRLPLTAERLASIDAMITDVEKHPAWIAKQSKIKKNIEKREEYDEHYAKVMKAMGE